MDFVDQIGHQITLKYLPKRIVSVVPSQTELLFDLGLNDAVIGITKFCIHPEEWFKTKTRVGGTKTLNLEKIKALNPDLIIANKEENTKEQIVFLQNKYPVWTSNISSLTDSLDMIRQIGLMTSTLENSISICNKIENDFLRLTSLDVKPLKTIYLIWKDPYMSVGSSTFIHHVLSKAGFTNLIKSNSNYPLLSKEEILELNPELIMLSSEPYPFKNKHKLELETWCPNAQVILVDGEMFSWYGSRLTKTVDYLIDLYSKIN